VITLTVVQQEGQKQDQTKDQSLLLAVIYLTPVAGMIT